MNFKMFENHFLIVTFLKIQSCFLDPSLGHSLPVLLLACLAVEHYAGGGLDE